MTIEELRRHAVTRSLFRPTSLPQALEVFGFVQADPIRAPARAQDLPLRHRVNYRVGGDWCLARVPVWPAYTVTCTHPLP